MSLIEEHVIINNELETEMIFTNFTYHWNIKNIGKLLICGGIINSKAIQFKANDVSLQGNFRLRINDSFRKGQIQKTRSFALSFRKKVPDDSFNIVIQFEILNQLMDSANSGLFEKHCTLAENSDGDCFTVTHELRYSNKGQLSGDELQLRIDMSIVRCKQSQDLIADSIKLDDNKSEVVTSTHICDLSKMFENPKFSDVSLSVDDFTIPVHKAILAAKSSVFSSMFEEQPEEKIFQLKNIDSFVLKGTVQYIYTGKTPSLNQMASGLLAAAQDYKLEELKILTQRHLCENITIENAGVLLLLADKYDAPQLKSQAMNFIKNHIKAILSDDGFQSLMETNSKLMREVFCHVQLNV